MFVLPTVYNGIKYRSRAEARWASAFDQFGWDYDYEPEAFEISGMRYLPDFYIRKLDFFFEVKGREPTVEEQLKADALCAATGKVVVISSGPPNPRRDQWDDDIFAYCPEMDCETGQLYADWHKGGFVYGRRETHPKSSLHLGNLMFLPVFNEADWQSVFLSSANQRFGIFE